MKDSLEIIKKIGSFLIVIVLVLMLGVTFSSQPLSEIIELLSGSSKVGSFQNKPILVKDYSMIYEQCKQYFQKFGFSDIPPALLQNCIYQQVVQLYIKPEIAKDLGLEVSKDSIENQLLQSVKEVYKQQKKQALPEDQISIEELYNREVNYFPIYKRVALINANLLDSFLLNPIPLSNEDLSVQQKITSYQIKIQSQILVFTSESLLKNIKVEVTEEEIKKKYEEDKKEHFSNPNQKDPYPDFKERYKFIKERLESEKKRVELSKIKENLGKVKNYQTFEELIRILNIQPIVKEFSINELDSIVINNEIKINANKKEFLKAILSNQNMIIGPIQDKEYTFYIKIEKIIVNQKQEEQLSTEFIQQLQNRQTGVFYEYIIEQYKNRGKFKLYDVFTQKTKK